MKIEWERLTLDLCIGNSSIRHYVLVQRYIFFLDRMGVEITVFPRYRDGAGINLGVYSTFDESIDKCQIYEDAQIGKK